MGVFAYAGITILIGSASVFQVETERIVNEKNITVHIVDDIAWCEFQDNRSFVADFNGDKYSLQCLTTVLFYKYNLTLFLYFI